jgi:WD40 repeat protein
LSVGDSSKVYLHQISGGARLSFTPIRSLNIPSPDISPFSYSTSLAASFSTAFSADGSKFAVASQEGVLVVWDVRSTKPLKVFQTDKNRVPGGGNGAASGWLVDDIFDWSGGGYRAPGWSVRNVKFGGSGKELMTFTEVCTLFPFTLSVTHIP